MKKPIVFFTVVSDLYYFRGGGVLFTNSFRRYHPDIDLVVFRQNMIDEHVYALEGGKKTDKSGKTMIALCEWKPFFARFLTKDYEKVIAVDSDTIITGRLDEVIEDDWELGGVFNLNEYENASFENITPEMYIQGGIIGSTKPEYWDIWLEANKDMMKYPRLDNDIINVLAYNHPIVSKYKLKIFDKDKDYYGCKSLGKEGKMYIENDELMLMGEKVKAYHHAKGPHLPKLNFAQMGFTKEVADWLSKAGLYGQSIKITSI